MNKELIIRSGSDAVDFALLKDGKLIELSTEKRESYGFNVGDIFLAKIRKPVAGLNACFVQLGYEKDAFLHFHDLGPNVNSMLKFIKLVSSGKLKNYALNKFVFEEEIDKNGQITEVINPNQLVLVQIAKEPISSKGPRITSEISLAGRYLVLVPFSDRISVSQKLESRTEKARLKKIVQTIKPKGYGVIVRTVAEGKTTIELEKDLQELEKKWLDMCKRIPQAHVPSKVHGEVNKTLSILRDMFNNSYTNIHVDDPAMLEETKKYIANIAPGKENIVKLYHNPNLPLFEKYHIERQIKTSFGKIVSMSKGTYLVIEHTEALHVIDVNSGNRSNKSTSQANTAIEVNLIAAAEIARQLRLRDMGGIIVIDFIDMHDPEHRRELYDFLKSEMSDDRAKHKILPPSKFGLIQLTRQRVRPEVNIKTSEDDTIMYHNEMAPIQIVDQITSELETLKKHKKIILNAHPFVAAFITKGFPSLRSKWFFEHKKWVKIIPRDAYKYLEYSFQDKKGNKIY